MIAKIEHHRPEGDGYQSVTTENRYQPKHRIYPVTEGIPSPYTQKAYQRSFERFLNFIKIHDLQVLLDFSPKVIKQIIVDYILYLRDEKPGKKLGRSSIKTHVSAILHFFQINNDDFNLTMKNFRIHLPANVFVIPILVDQDKFSPSRRVEICLFMQTH